MADASHIYAGVAGYFGKPDHTGKSGVFQRAAKGGDWKHVLDGVEAYTVFVKPDNPEVVFAGTNDGVWRSTDRGNSFKRAAFPDKTQVWSFMVDSRDPKKMLAGASPIDVYRSDDGGDHWKKLADPGLPNRVHMAFACRVMRLDADPNSPDDIYATMEANGAMRSRDAGESWEDCTADLIRFCEDPKYKSRIGSQTEIEGMLDGHALACSAAAPGTVFLANRMGLFRSNDKGAHWEDMEIGRFSPLTYGRDVRTSPLDPKVLYAALSPAARSTDGSVYRSDDVGKTWTRFDRGIKADATMMGVIPHPTDPNQVYAISRVGQVFGTQDGGKTWSESRLPEGSRDSYCIACG